MGLRSSDMATAFGTTENLETVEVSWFLVYSKEIFKFLRNASSPSEVPSGFFFQMWWNIILLRGFGYLFSLKDVQDF
jgi:hypothetical protein